MQMTVSDKDMFLAILAMDSYNRGYDAGIKDGDANDTNGSAPMLLTGHSLGGALAGITAALTGTDSVLVDNIGFNNALEELVQAYNQLKPYLGFASYQSARELYALNVYGHVWGR
jgi:Lipase (class 3)